MTGEDWRARKKNTTRRLIQEHALRLFAEKGYDATTVEEIAAAAGVSHMTFFRYFPRKESVVETREYDPMLEKFILDRPQGEPALAAISTALRASLAAIFPRDRDRWLARVRLMMSTPDLYGRAWVAQSDTRDLFARALAERAGLAEPDFVCTVQAATAVAAFVAALSAWAQDDAGDLLAIIDAAFAAAAAAAAAEPSAETMVIGRR